MIVDFEFYSTVYMGSEVDEASFPSLSAKAEDVVGAMAHWAVSEDNLSILHPKILTLYKKAVCAQIDFFGLNGLESAMGGTDRGFTVGKVSMSGKSGSDLVRKGAMVDSIAPMARMYLEQTGLMNPQVPTLPEMSIVGLWW